MMTGTLKHDRFAKHVMARGLEARYFVRKARPDAKA
jgi:hypothetical protein